MSGGWSECSIGLATLSHHKTGAKYRSAHDGDPLGGLRERRLDGGEDFVEGGGGPAEGMGGVVPLVDEGGDLDGEVGAVGEVRVAEALAAEDAEPLLDLIHPGAMHGGEVHPEAGMGCQPRPDRCAMMDADVVTDQMDGGDRGWDELVEVVEEAEAFHLALAAELAGGDCPAACIEGGEELEGAVARVFMFELDRVAGAGGSGGRATVARLQGGHLIQAEHGLPRRQGTSVEVGNLADRLLEGGIPRRAGMEPEMAAPGFEPAGSEDALHRLGRDRGHDPLRDELPRQLCAVPLTQRAAGLVGQLTGAMDDVESHLRGKRSAVSPTAADPGGPPGRRHGSGRASHAPPSGS